MDESEEISGFNPPAIEELNQWLSGYEFIDLIACGGMGAVYRARQISLDRMVAIKILPPELAVNETFRESFEAEGKAMAKLSHSNLVGVYDFGEISDMLYLVIEFVEGSNLYESKGNSAIDPETAVTLVSSVAAGLAEAHRIGLVHRDIKPANILINTDVIPKLGDFGLAVPDSDIESGLMMGTPAYLPPEVMADPSSASFASDTFALGVILYEMLTGKSIEGGDEIDLSLVPMLGDLPKIVRKAVDPKPLLRYHDGEALESALKEWMRKPKSSGLAMKSGGPALQPKITPDLTESGGGNGGLLLGLVALLIVGGLLWAVFGRSSDSDDASDPIASDSPAPVTVDPLVSKEADTKAEEALEKLRTSQQQALQELSDQLAGERAQNRLDFLEAAGGEGSELLETVRNKSADLPRFFCPGEVAVSEGLLTHLRNFVTSRQAGIDRKYQREISSLHWASLKDLRAADVELPQAVNSSWEGWAEWLGQNPIEVMQTSLAGLWRAPGPDGLAIEISSGGGQVWVSGEVRIMGSGFAKVDESGVISLQESGQPPSKLRWLGDRLEGLDGKGERQVLKLQPFDYADFLKKEDEPVIPPTGMTEIEPKETSPKFETFQDSEVASLSDNYRKALNEKIEPLESGYVRILEIALETFRSDAEEVAVEQIDEELERVKLIKWREGFAQMSTFPKPGELPSEVAKKQAVFQKEFERRYEALKRTYLQALQKMLRVRKGRGERNLGDIEKAIKKTETVEGAVQARYIKIESLPDEGIRHATIALIDILDLTGKNLPIKNFSKVRASSVEDRDSDGSSTIAEKAIDGDSKTFWHTKWKGTRAEFPHWLSFDLGDEHWITGFRITSRKYKDGRSTDITNWRFHVSSDGRNWTVVAKGNFPQGNQTNEHLGFEVVE